MVGEIKLKNVHKTKLILEGENKSAIAAIEGVSKKLGRAQRDIKGFSGGITSALGSVGSVITNLPFLMSAAATGVVAGLGTMVKSTIDTAEHLEKMSQRVGLSAESLSTLSYAAQLSGTDIGVFENAIQRLSRNVDDASRGIGDGKIAFEQLGVSVVNTDGTLRNAEIIMKDVADKFATMEDGTKKTALALKIFGRAGADLIPMLNGGAAALNSMQQEARDLGLEISTNTAEHAAEFKDNMFRLESSLTGLAYRALPPIISMLTDFTDGIIAANDAAADSDNILEFMMSLTAHATMEGFESAMRQHRKNLVEAIKLAENQARATASNLSNRQILELIEERKKVIAALKKLDQDESTKNTIAQEEAKLKIYKQITGGIRATTVASEQLAKQWQSVSTSLSNQAQLAGLNKTYAEFVKIDQKVEALHKKFGNKQIITEWASTMKAALLDANSVSINLKPEYSVPDITDNLHPVEFNTTYYNMQKEQIASVTEFEKANLVLRQQGTLNMFANMTDAARMFYQSSGEQSKTAFEAYKIFASAEAAITGYKSVINAYEWGMKFGGPILAGASAAAAGLFTIGQIAQINSTQMGGGRVNVPSTPLPTTIPNTNNYNNYNNRNPIYNTFIIKSDWNQGDGDKFVREEIIPALEKYINYGGSIKGIQQ